MHGNRYPAYVSSHRCIRCWPAADCAYLRSLLGKRIQAVRRDGECRRALRPAEVEAKWSGDVSQGAKLDVDAAHIQDDSCEGNSPASPVARPFRPFRPGAGPFPMPLTLRESSRLTGRDRAVALS